ncbi:MAG: hypothetical protein RL240_4084 [Planctomycetota bacterium]|jgi:hypothetical protein
MTHLLRHRTTRSRAIKFVETLLFSCTSCSCGLIANIAPVCAQEPVVAQESVPTPKVETQPEVESSDVPSEEPLEIPIPQFSDAQSSDAQSSEAQGSESLSSDKPGVYVSPSEQQVEISSDQNLSDAAANAPAVQVGKNRFQTPASKDYLVQRARAESAARAALLERYRKAGWNYGQPTIDSNVWYSLRTTPRYKNFFVVPMRPVIE